MEMNLETIQDIRFFRNNWKTIYRNNKALDNITNAKVVISAKLLSDFFIEEESFKDKILTELNLLKYNFVEEWIDFTIDVVYDNEENPKPESEIKKDVIDSIKVELTNFKAEKDYNSIDWGNYNFIGMVLDYGVKFEDIVDKVEKDLAEIEAVPVNAVEEEAVELEGK